MISNTSDPFRASSWTAKGAGQSSETDSPVQIDQYSQSKVPEVQSGGASAVRVLFAAAELAPICVSVVNPAALVGFVLGEGALIGAAAGVAGFAMARESDTGTGAALAVGAAVAAVAFPVAAAALVAITNPVLSPFVALGACSLAWGGCSRDMG